MITALLLAAAPATAHHSTMGVHGMALFGGADGLFASHLPLFRPPHDRQILLEIQAEDAALDRQLRAGLAADAKLWTIEPERFELARLLPDAAAPLRRFRANVVQGHFERGGRTVHKDVPFRIVRVLANRPIAPGSVKPIAIYHPVGRGRTWFLVKKIDGRPDFDHIVALAPGSQPRTIYVQRQGERQPATAILDRALAGKARVRTTVYFETDDLR